jgi:hypothetical protein
MLAAALVVSDAAAQEAARRGRAISLLQLDTNAFRAVESLADVALSWTGPRPSAVPEFAFTDTRAFDMQAHESLKAKLPRVNVLVDGDFTAAAVPERMSQWLNKIRSSGGQVRTCVVQTGPATRSIGLAATLGLKLFQRAESWRLYQPAGVYDALLLVDEDGRTLRNVLFTAKGVSTAACPGGRTTPTPAVVQGEAAAPAAAQQPALPEQPKVPEQPATLAPVLPDSSPIPEPTPAVDPTVSPSRPSSGVVPGMSAAAGPRRMCGTAHNVTHGFRTPVELVLTSPDGFAGELKVPDTRYTGGGVFSGSAESGQCRGVTSGGLTITGACPTDRFAATYEISGQTGQIEVSTAACTG